MENKFLIPVLALIGPLVVLAFYPLFKTITSDGSIDYCYVTTMQRRTYLQPDVVTYDVYGFRPWRSDRPIAQNLRSLEEAKEAATIYGCRLK